MINLRQLYQIAPELQPHSPAHPIKKPLTPLKLDPNKSSQIFRRKLLSNLLTFRGQRDSSYQTHLYQCPSRKSVSTFRSTQTQSTFSHFSLENSSILTEKKSKKLKKAQKIEKSLMASLTTEKSSYQSQLAHQLKSTLPKFLESSRKKALRNIC
jgi:hypothetical protein